jgi:hypothetical protein
MTYNYTLIEANLTAALAEIRGQPNISKDIPLDRSSFADEIEQILGWIEDHGEYGIAYEALIALLEAFPFQLSGRAAVKLLEVGLLFRFKTEQPKDALFDSR